MTKEEALKKKANVEKYKKELDEMVKQRGLGEYYKDEPVTPARINQLRNEIWLIEDELQQVAPHLLEEHPTPPVMETDKGNDDEQKPVTTETKTETPVTETRTEETTANGQQTVADETREATKNQIAALDSKIQKLENEKLQGLKEIERLSNELENSNTAYNKVSEANDDLLKEINGLKEDKKKLKEALTNIAKKPAKKLPAKKKVTKKKK